MPFDLPLSHFDDLAYYLDNSGQADALDATHALLSLAKPIFCEFASQGWPSKNAAERKEIESGTFRQPQTGKALRLSAEFKQEAFFLSDQLNLSETLCATLLVESGQSRHGNQSDVTGGITESAVILFYSIRQKMLSTIEKTCEMASSPTTETSYRSMLVDFLEDLVSAEDGKSEWPTSLLNSLDRLSNDARAITQQASTGAPAFSQPSTSQTTQASFGQSLQVHRVQCLQNERRTTGNVIHLLATSGLLPKPTITSIIRWLASKTQQEYDDRDNRAVILRILTAALAAFDPTRKSVEESSALVLATSDMEDVELTPPPFLQLIFNDAAFLKTLHSEISTNKDKWKLGYLNAVVLLQWTLFFSHAAQANGNLENDTEIWEDAIEADVYRACTGGALDFMLSDLLSFDPTRSQSLVDFTATYYNPRSNGDQTNIDAAFQNAIVRQLESTVVTLIATMHQILRKMKNREEDARLLANARSSSRRMEQSKTAEPKHDIQSLFLLIAAIYRLHPDDEAALKFWVSELDPTPAHRLNAFLRWASDVRPVADSSEDSQDGNNLLLAFFEMLASLSRGQKAATSAFEFLAANSPEANNGAQVMCSWTTFFGIVGHFAGLLQSANAPTQGLPGSRAPPPPAATEIPPEEVASIRALARLATAIVAHSPIAKAALFDNQKYKPVSTLFGLVIHPIRLDLKGDLLDCIAAFSAPSGQTSQAQTLSADVARRTWLLLEQSQILPTLAPSAQGKIESGIVAELEMVEGPAESYPTTTAFVNLLASLIHPKTKQEVDAGVQKSALDRFNSGNAASDKSIPPGLGSPQRRPGVVPYVTFVVDTVLLSLHTRRFKNLHEQWRLTLLCLKFVLSCLQNYDDTVSNARSITASLSDASSQAGIEIVVQMLGGGQLLAKVMSIAATALDEVDAPQAPPSLRGSVDCALQILNALLNVERHFMDIALPVLLENSTRLPVSYNSLRSVQSMDDALLNVSGIHIMIPRIATLVNSVASNTALLSVRFVNALALTRRFSVNDAHATVAQPHARINRLVGFLDSSEESERITSGYSQKLQESDGALQLEIINMLLANAAHDKTTPNLAHYLLGYTFKLDSRGNVEVEDDASRSCLYGTVAIILGTLSTGASYILAEHCYRLLHLLCSNDTIAQTTLRYLRTQYDLAIQTIAAIPFQFVHGEDEEINIKSQSGQYAASPLQVGAALRAQSWAFELIMLEIGDLSILSQKERLAQLVTALVALNEDPEGSTPAYICVVEALDALSFEWDDPRKNQNTPAPLFGDLPFDTYLRLDSNDCPIYDIGMVVDALQSRRQELANRGSLQTHEHQQQAYQEICSILSYFSVENTRREIEGARLQSLQAWCRAVSAVLLVPGGALANPAPVIPVTTILEGVYDVAVSQKTQEEALEILFEVTFAGLSYLREEQSTVAANKGELERIGQLTRNYIDALTQTDTTTKMRGLICACATNGLRLLFPADGPAHHKPLDPLQQKQAGLIQSTVGSNITKLCGILSADATSGSDVWQMAALNLLEALYALGLATNGATRLLQPLVKQNHLHRLVQSLSTSQGEIASAIGSEDAALNPVYIYETKMSLFLRIASTPEGVEKLLEARLLNVLSSCDFLNAQPDFSQSAVSQNNFLPSTEERYHQVLLATLQLLVGCSSSSNSARVSSQVLHFVLTYREPLLATIYRSFSAATPTLLEECHLIVFLLRVALRSITRQEFSSAAVFGSIHSAVLLLAAQIMGNAIDSDAVSLLSLSQVTMSYLLQASQLQNEFRPVLLPEPKDSAYTNRQPTVGSCLPYLRRLCARLARSAESVHNEQTDKVASAPSQELQGLLHLVESILMLFLRHIDWFYRQNHSSASPLLIAGQLDTPTAKASLLQTFKPIGARLYEDLNLNAENLGWDPRPHQALLEQAVRRIMDVLV